MSHAYAPYTCLTFPGLLTVIAMLLPASAIAATTNQGIAYGLDDGAAAYRETHLMHESGGHLSRLVLYRCVDGSTFARKTVVERSGAVTPDFELIDGRSGYREGVRTTDRGREVFWQKSASAAEKKKTLHLPADAVIDSGFNELIRTQWTRVATEDGISGNFLLPSALRFLKVSIKRTPEKPQPGVVHLRMKLDTWFGFVAPDTELDYRIGDRRLLRFKGIGTIRDGRGRNLAVRIEFPGGLQARQVTSSEFEAARQMPLTGRCGA